MPVSFTLDNNFGYLEWRSPGSGAPDLTAEEAATIAAAEQAAALRYIGQAIYALAEAVQESGRKED